MRCLLCTDHLRNKGSFFDWWQLLVPSQLLLVDICLFAYVVLRYDLHLSELMLIDEVLGEHVVGN